MALISHNCNHHNSIDREEREREEGRERDREREREREKGRERERERDKREERGEGEKRESSQTLLRKMIRWASILTYVQSDLDLTINLDLTKFP